MAKFFVGQRVRIVRSEHEAGVGAMYVGQEDRIVGKSLVFADCWKLERAQFGMDGRPLAWRPTSITPIQPEGMQPARWEDCLWQPNKECA